MKMKSIFKIQNSPAKTALWENWQAVLKNYKKEGGLKKSTKRLWIVDYFFKKDRHFNVEELYNQIKRLNPKISRTTVYRTLKFLAACGLAVENKFDEKNVRYEPVHFGKHHDHFVCLKCGKFFEFEEQAIEKLQAKVAKRHQFKVIKHKLELYGYCKDCQKK